MESYPVNKLNLKDFLKSTRVILTLIFLLTALTLLTAPVFAATPSVGTISPVNGSTSPGIAVTLTSNYSDTDGWTNLKEAYLLISTSSATLTNSVYLYYDQNTNKLYLRNDANNSWLGGYSPGSYNTIENSQVRLYSAYSYVSGAANTLTLRWCIIFKSAFAGKTYNTYLKVVDDNAGFNDWIQKGTYAVNRLPEVGTITPTSSEVEVGILAAFTTTYSDFSGWQNIHYAHLLINSALSGTNCLYAYYDQNTNKLYLRNDSSSAWLGGFSPGSSNFIENSYTRIDCLKTTISGSGTTLTINWRISFKTPFIGKKNAYLRVINDLGSSANWLQKGTCTIKSPVNKIPLEAETATIIAPFQVYTDSQASSGGYILIPNGSGNNFISPGGPGGASFSFNVPQADLYQVWARVIAPSDLDNSFFVHIDNGPAQLWDIPQGLSWHWAKVSDRTNGTFNANLSSGSHTLYFKQREDGASLDKIILTNDTNFVPGADDVTLVTDTPPQITGVTPADGSTFYEGDTIVISPQVLDTDPSPLAYQFSLDGIIKQAFSGLSTYSWTALKGIHTLKIEVRDAGGQDTKQVEVCIFRKPITPP